MMKFYRCNVCGQVLGVVNDTRRTPICCEEEMTMLEPITRASFELGSEGHSSRLADANKNTASVGMAMAVGAELLETHVPIWKKDGNIVTVHVGKSEHPSTETHHIEWIALETVHGNQRHILRRGDKPSACFSLCDGDEVIAAYAYCNLHKLYKG